MRMSPARVARLIAASAQRSAMRCCCLMRGAAPRAFHAQQRAALRAAIFAAAIRARRAVVAARYVNIHAADA